jgi:protocatechuate 3,4-dioxygenase beta subunit
MSYRFFAFPAVWALIVVGAAGAAERVTANGKVVGVDGKPVEQATVLVYEARTRNGYSVYCPTCWVDCGKRTITNAEGEYSISGLNPDLVFKLLVVKNGQNGLRR